LKVQPSEPHRCRNRKQTLWGTIFAGRGLLGLPQFIENPLASDEEALTNFGQNYLAGRAMQEPYTHVALEIEDPSIDRREGDSELPCGRRKSARLRNGNER
jgi:hypothetical protein